MENKKNNFNSLSREKRQKVKTLDYDGKSKRWTVKVALLAFFISLLLSLFSESIQRKGSVILAIVLIVLFMAVNIISDMLGLAITSCQIEQIEREAIDKKLKNKCKRLIQNSDKVSSILCDVVGDICGILCGVSGSIVSIYISNSIDVPSLIVFIGGAVSALIAGVTVLFKSISKNYAVNNAKNIVIKIGKFLNRLYA